MNKKGNERYHETEQRIRKVFFELLEDKDLQEITVSEICKKADIHRTTFYSHCEDIYDLMQKTIKDIYMHEMDAFLRDDSIDLKKGFLSTFSLIRKNQSFFLYYFKHYASFDYGASILPEPLIRNLQAFMKKTGYRNEEELKYHQTFFCAGLIGIITRWISGGCRESEEKLYAILQEEYDTEKRRSLFEQK